jgi:hypothetical protein
VQDDLRPFIREQTSRMEKATLHMERALVRMGDRMERSLERMGERLDDDGKQIRANTDAVLVMLDRLDNGRA